MKTLKTVGSGALSMARTAFSRQGLILLSLAFAAMLIVSGVSGQKAHAYAWECPSGTLCIYTNINYGDPLYVAWPSVGVCYNMPAGFNDQMSSYISSLIEGRLVYFYVNGCDTNPYMAVPVVSSSAWIGSTMNDKISSYKVYN